MAFVARQHPQQDYRDPVNDRATTWEVFAPLDDRFGFTLDVAANDENAKLPRYFDMATDGLAQSWAGERVWCNPPYRTIPPWVEKAWTEHNAADLIVMLLPANRTEQGWWQDLVEPELRARRPDFAVEFLRGRMRFIAPGADDIPPNSRPPFGVCLLIWNTPCPSLLGSIL